MSEPSITKVTGEELPASELNQLIIEALNDYRDFTLGENISANIPVYLKASDSKIYKTSSAADDEKIHSFVGILKEAGSTNDVKKVQVSGKVVGLSGLTAGQKVYLRDTAGEYGAIGTYEKQIGIAISTTSIILRVQNEGDLTQKAQTITGVKTFGSIPVGPASNPTTDNQLVRKLYADTYYFVGLATDFDHDFINAEDNNYDEAIAVGFTPRIVKLTYWMEGHCGGQGQAGFKGIAFFNGSGTLIANVALWNLPETYFATGNNYPADLGTNARMNKTVSQTGVNMIAGDLGSNNGGKLTLTLISFTSTGFTIRKRTQAQTFGTGKARFSALIEVYK